MNKLGRAAYFEQYGDVPQPSSERIKQTIELISESARARPATATATAAASRCHLVVVDV